MKGIHIASKTGDALTQSMNSIMPQNVPVQVKEQHLIMSDSEGKNQHVVPREDGWAVRGEGNSRDTVRTNTQAEAIDAATEIAKNQQSEVVIHGKDGRIRERNSHGNDPFPPKG